MSEQDQQYSIVNVTDEQDGVIAGGGPRPLVLNTADGFHSRPLSARGDLKKVIAEWAENHDLSLGVYDILIDTDEDDDVRIILPDLTINREGDIVRKTREYAVTAEYVVQVVVTVEASSEEEARDKADSDLNYASFDVEWVDGGEVTDVDYRGIVEVDEQ